MNVTTNRINGHQLNGKAKQKPTRRTTKQDLEELVIAQQEELDKLQRQVEPAKDRLTFWVAVVTALSTTLLSMWLNVVALTTQPGWVVVGTIVGVLIPLWVLSTTYLGGQANIWWKRAGCFGLAGFALIVSLPHLAAGFNAMGLQSYEAWSLAIVADLTQVFSKTFLLRD